MFPTESVGRWRVTGAALDRLHGELAASRRELPLLLESVAGHLPKFPAPGAPVMPAARRISGRPNERLPT